MDRKENDFIKVIFEKIDDLFTEEVGPVALILSDEIKSDWVSELNKKGHRPGLRNMPVYVHKLSMLIDDEHNRQNFLDSVFEIEALSPFNKS
jgi:hypothetical protein